MVHCAGNHTRLRGFPIEPDLGLRVTVSVITFEVYGEFKVSAKRGPHWNLIV